MKEVWRDVREHYQVSNRGRVRSKARLLHYGRGKYRAVPGRLLKGHTSSHGYHVVSQGESRKEYVHALVAEAFLGPRPDGLTVNHKDGCKKNNRVANLEYISNAENTRHAQELGLIRQARGSDSGRAKLTEKDVRQILRRIRKGDRIAAIAADYGVTTGPIYHIKNRTQWKHVA
jgi:uncharacterized protein (DUF433 family)